MKTGEIPSGPAIAPLFRHFRPPPQNLVTLFWIIAKYGPPAGEKIRKRLRLFIRISVVIFSVFCYTYSVIVVPRTDFYRSEVFPFEFRCRHLEQRAAAVEAGPV